MIAHQDPDTEELLQRARRGDHSAVEQLLGRHRSRLRRMVAVRMDERLSARVDPSDVVQEALSIACKRLPGYLRRPPISFYAWLRQIAWNCLVDLHRRHIAADKRSVAREEPMHLSGTSAAELGERLKASGTSHIKRLVREELRARVQAAIAKLAPAHREILVLRYLEQLDGAQCAAVLGISRKAANQRHLRAVRRLHRLLGDDTSGET